MKTIQLNKTKRSLQVEKLSKTMELIELCDHRIELERDWCRELYGVNERGNIRATQININLIERYQSIKERLKKYYNSQIDSLLKY